jgi:hypothetical protein
VGSKERVEGLLVSNRSIQDLFNESVNLVNADKFDEAIPSLETILKLHPLVTSAYVQRGRVHWEMHRWDKAMQDFQMALRLDPDQPDGKWTMGLMKLQLGEFDGWELYESRWESVAFKSPKLKTKLPRWEPDKGYKSCLVWCEQGIGDQILYGSLLRALRMQVNKLTVMIDVRLIRLFADANLGIDFIRHDSKIKNSEFDCQIPIASIGKHFIHDLSSINEIAATNYLKTSPERVAQVKSELGIKPGDFVVGLSWASTAPRIDVHKSIALRELKEIFEIPNVKVVNLQYGKPKEEIEPFEKETGHRLLKTSVNTFFDLEGVAAMMELCDVIVACSNANVHIAGALGKRVLVLDANKLWYWNHKVFNRSLWYPSVKLFNRKDMISPWDEQVKQVMQELKEIRNEQR